MPITLRNNKGDRYGKFTNDDVIGEDIGACTESLRLTASASGWRSSNASKRSQEPTFCSSAAATASVSALCCSASACGS